MKIIIYTHSDYFDILPVQLAYVKKYVDEEEIYIWTNQKYPDSEYTQILYDSNLPYASRLLFCLQHVSSDYILLTHENDIICHYDKVFIHELLETMSSYNIDLIDLKHESTASHPLYVRDDIYLVKKPSYFYCVQPSLWRVDTLKAILEAFPHKTYRTIEHDDVQKYCKENFSVRGLSSVTPIQSIWYKVSPYYCYLHLTSRLLLLPCKKENGLHYFLQEEHENIYANFLYASKRGKQETIYSFDNRVIESTET